MNDADAARAKFVDLIDASGKSLGKRPTTWDGASFIMGATVDETAGSDLLRFTDADGLVVGELPIQRQAAE